MATAMAIAVAIAMDMSIVIGIAMAHGHGMTTVPSNIWLDSQLDQEPPYSFENAT